MSKNILSTETEFMQLLDKLTDGKFYVPTGEHSSGFNEVEIYEVESNKPYKLYNVEEENDLDKAMSFEEIISKYPQFALTKKLAFDGKFECWTDYEEALSGEIKESWKRFFDTNRLI